MTSHNYNTSIEPKYPRHLKDLSLKIGVASFPHLLSRFIAEQMVLKRQVATEENTAAVSVHSGRSELEPENRWRESRPLEFKSLISVYHSATSIFRAPSDLSGMSGLKRELIRSAPNWRNKGPRRDCVFVETDPDSKGMRGLNIARVRLIFSFQYEGENFPCALVHWFDKTSDIPDENTGMWVVEPKYLDCEQNGHDHQPKLQIVHTDTILRAAHLLPVFGRRPVEDSVTCTNSLDRYDKFYVNKYVDHHANEIAF